MLGARGLVRTGWAAAAVCVAVALACTSGSDRATGTTQTITTIVVIPDSATVVVGSTQSLAAKPENASGTAVAGVSVVWAASDTTIATVDTMGTVSARAPGTARVAASAQGVTGYATVVVTARPVTSVTISPNPATVALNGTTTLTATLRDASGDTLGGQTVTWSSSDTTTLTVTPSTGQTQVVTGKKGGSATISATSTNSVTGTDVVTVTRPVSFIQVTPNPLSVRAGSTVQATAQAFDANSIVITGTTFSWTTMSGGSIARVNGTGLVTGVAAGSDSVYAQAGGKQGGAPVTVTPNLASAITLTPAPDSTTLNGEALTLTATAYAGGNQIPGTIALSIGDKKVAQLSATSVQSGQTFMVDPGGPNTGTTTVQASINGQMTTATITVYPHDTITTQHVTISEYGVSGATSATLTVIMRNADGTLDITSQPTWTGSDGGTLLTFAPNPSPNNGAGSSSTTVTATGTFSLPKTVTVTATTASGTATTKIGVGP